MVQIPDSLRSVFSATVDERGGKYVFEVPQGEIDHDAVEPGATYRVALFESGATPGTTTPEAGRSGTDAAGPGGPGGVPEPPVDEGEIREVTIETVGDQGDGIAKVERGYVLIVPGARPGEAPTVEVETVKRNVAFATVVDAEED
jgi:predicted RNA-binding protein with TRAM domain